MVFCLVHTAVWVVSTPSTAPTILGKGPESLEDGSVACTATEVSLEGILDLLNSRLRLVPEQCVHTHDNARSAEPTLGTMASGNSLLYRMQFLGVSYAFHGGHSNMVQGADGGQAGIDRKMNDLVLKTVILGDHHGACSTATFSTAKLGPT